MRIHFHNRELEALHVSGLYHPAQVEAIASALEAHQTLQVTPLSTGLFPAAGAQMAASGYGNVWVRDNVYVALAQWESGRPEVAAGVARGLLTFYGKYRHRLEAANPGD